jgi:membrane protease YdiL (CAAX protease family)
MSAVGEIIILLLVLAYAAVQVAALVVWSVHRYRVAQGQPGFIAERWSLLDLWVGFHVALLLTLGMLVVMAFWGGLMLALFSPHSLDTVQRAFLVADRDSPLIWAMLLPLLVVQNVAFVVTTVLYMVGKYGLDVNALGLRWDWQSVRVGVLWGGLAFVITPLVELLSVGVLRLVLGGATFQQLMDWERQTVALEGFLESLQPGPALVGFVLVVALAAPIGEELFFRGFVFNVLRNRLNFSSAVWLSAGLFALLHVSVKNFLPILVIGVLLARLYALRGSLWSCVVMHGTFNFLSAVAAILTGGLG